jgi:ATP-dependent RNA helicase SUPV3L1/SUV3
MAKKADKTKSDETAAQGALSFDAPASPVVETPAEPPKAPLAAGRFTLTDDGALWWQPDSTNPLKGKTIGTLRKGADILSPVYDLAADGELSPEAQAALDGWLSTHIATVLEPLKTLMGEGGLSAKVAENLGIVPRAEVESLIAALTPEERQALRNKKVRFGPLLIFAQGLTRPAAVHLRALLWNLWHGLPLPAALPSDGMTSFSLVGKEGFDPLYYRAIGYPVCGTRAIRADMLDRLISAIYDTAKDGLFQAQHQMAEWLGCPIAELYAVLESLGHTKVSDPADNKPKDEEKPSEEAAVIVAEPEKTEAPEAAPVETPTAKPVQVKPDLATFRLRRGKAYSTPRPPRSESIERPERKSFSKPDKPKHDDKKFKSKKRDDRKDKDKDRERDTRERVYKSSVPVADPDDSPFAILKQLKGKGDGA